MPSIDFDSERDRLHDRYHDLLSELSRAYQERDEMCDELRQWIAANQPDGWVGSLRAERDELRKSLALVQQHAKTAWNRGHTMGIESARQQIDGAINAREQANTDRYADNARLTDALLAAEDERDRLRAENERLRLALSAPVDCITETRGPNADTALHEARRPRRREEVNTIHEGAPERIWLNVGGDTDEPYPADHDGVTWCWHQIDYGDIEYVRADRIEALQAGVERLRLQGDEFAELARLREEVKGPDGFATWRDAAVSERMEKVKFRTELVQAKAEVERLQAEVERLKASLHRANETAEHFERHWRLRGDENERLTKDARRYRWLRDGGIYDMPYRDYGSGPEYDKDKWDAAIDEALAAQQGGER